MSSVTDSPEYQAALKPILDQMRAEGAGGLEIASTSQAFEQTFTGLYSGLQSQYGISVSAGEALEGASRVIAITKTTRGALDLIQGLQARHLGAGAQTEMAIQASQAFVGLMIAVAGGTSATGVGAAVGAAIMIGVAILSSLGMFNDQPVLASKCGVEYSGQKPDWFVGCQAFFGDRPPSPSNTGWRKFPTVAAPMVRQIFNFETNWLALPKLQSAAPEGGRTTPLENAFETNEGVPIYVQFLCDLRRTDWGTEVQKFLQGFFAAWQANAEYAMNGWKAQADYEVFAHYLALWNRTHKPTTRFEFGMSGIASRPIEDLRNCPGPYTIVGKMVDDNLRYNGNIGIAQRSGDFGSDRCFINTGGEKAVPVAPGPRPISFKGLHSLLMLSAPAKAPSAAAAKASPRAALLGAGAGAAAALVFVGLGPVVLLGAALGAVIGHALGAPKPPPRP